MSYNQKQNMNILFLHRSYPSQYQYVLQELAKNPLNFLMFAHYNKTTDIKGVNAFQYPIATRSARTCHPFLPVVEGAILHGQGAANIAYSLQKRDIKPDLICGHSWGPPMFMKDIFPDVPLLCYFEWFNSFKEPSNLTFRNNDFSEVEAASDECGNSLLFNDLVSCDAGISPTEWQKSRFPEEFHDKIHVIHDGVNTKNLKRNDDAVFELETEKGTIKLSKSDEVVTYTTRGMEPYRGFCEFMEAAYVLQKRRPNLHIVVAGKDENFYSPVSKIGSYKKEMLQKYKYDMSRLHFTGTLPFEKYISLLQVSKAHVYLTVPFVLSWSIMEAMACECPIVASATAPVKEVVQDGYNGILFDFFNINDQVEKIEFALSNPDKMEVMRKNARKTILDKYDIDVVFPQHVELMQKLINK
ncbi:MAG: glycosyltransferase [bacterium]|nr:glycosyltransferase [bacterium]